MRSPGASDTSSKRPPEDRRPRYPELHIPARQVSAMRQPHDINGDRAHFSSEMGRYPLRQTRGNLLFRETRPILTVLMDEMDTVRSPPNVPVSGETSLARSSRSLAARFSTACSMTFSVSAANPTTSPGRGSPPRRAISKCRDFLSAPEQADHCRPSSFFPSPPPQRSSQKQPQHIPQRPPATRPHMPPACPPRIRHAPPGRR